MRIEKDVIAGYAAALPPAAFAAPELDPSHHYFADVESTAAFVFTLDTINFGSGYWPILQKRPGLGGYLTIATCLKEAFERDGPWSAEALSTITPEQCAVVFGQIPDFPLMARQAVALNEFGRYLLEACDGQPLALLESVDGSAELLTERLASLPSYQDVATHDGEAVAFYKRAQLVSADLDAALAAIGKRGKGEAEAFRRFHDLRPRPSARISEYGLRARAKSWWPVALSYLTAGPPRVATRLGSKATCPTCTPDPSGGLVA